jgi:hypothetical protein
MVVGQFGELEKKRKRKKEERKKSKKSKCPNAQMPKCPNAQLPNCQNAKIPKTLKFRFWAGFFPPMIEFQKLSPVKPRFSGSTNIFFSITFDIKFAKWRFPACHKEIPLKNI